MTREYARVKLAIWADTDFRSLTDGAQALYFRLLSSPTMSLCGVADWRPKRLAALTNGMTSDLVEATADELRTKGYIVTDDETEEVLVRSFVRHDGLIKTPNIAAAMCKDYAGTASATLRGVIVHELARLYEDDPAMKGWSVAAHLLTNPSVNPSGMASVNPSGMALANGSANGSHIPHPSSLIPHPATTRKKAARSPKQSPKSETELPEDWKPTAAHKETAEEHGINLDHEADQFRNRSVAKGLTYVNWNAAFSTWLGNAKTWARPVVAAVRKEEDVEWMR